MNKRLLSLAVAGAMVLGLAGVASAGIPDETTSSAAGPGSPVVALITPQSTGNSIASVGGTVTVTVLDFSSGPVANYPFSDIYIDDDGTDEISLCQGGSVADANTNASGVTTISGLIGGGGFATQSNVWIAGTKLTGPALDLGFNSPDNTGDLVVDIADFSNFGLDFGGAAFRSDLVFDGIVDIADFSKFGLTFGETCP